MIKSCVTIALVPQIKTGPWIYWDNLEESLAKASHLGFAALELFTASGKALEVNYVADLLDKYNVKIAAVGTGAGKVIQNLTLTDPNPEVRQEAIAFIAEMIKFGAHFNAPAIIGSMQGNILPGIARETALGWLQEGLTQLGAIADNLQVPLIYEPLNRYETNLANNLAAGAEILDSLPTKAVKLLADLFHMNIEEASIPESILKYGKYIGHVHFADSNRRPVGFGHTAMPEVAAALQAIGYTGYISAEAFPYPNPDAAASQTINAFQQYFRN